ncbi:hypothetical protein E0H82_07880 [Acinetobacter sp. ANC 4910]|nr:hypothetical protein [Acinetobacter sp. ANC 4910]TCB35884.1 hypothetical protein E0H82_07880 [Acinetobacter sp. ANC 4910]
MRKTFTQPLVLMVALGMGNTSIWANTSDAQEVPPASLPYSIEQAPTTEDNLFYTIPRWIDSAPTVLPEQSDEQIVPSTVITENQTWIDRKQKLIRNWADDTSQNIDGWFGEKNTNTPASATLRVLIDNRWNKYDEYDIKPRIRGKISLPNLEKKLSLVFGDDSLDNELANNVAITNENPPSPDNDKAYDRRQNRDANSSLALRWSDISKRLPFATDFDVGVRSGDDIYLRLKAKKDWTLENDFFFHAEQIYRYGVDSENYLRTNLELTHARPNEAFLSDQFSLTYADMQQDDLNWDNYAFRQHQFFQGNQFNYGLYTGGYLDNSNLRLNSWGPFISWRQPLWREWFYVQTDINYYNDDRADHSHYLSTLLRLEALF